MLFSRSPAPSRTRAISSFRAPLIARRGHAIASRLLPFHFRTPLISRRTLGVLQALPQVPERVFERPQEAVFILRAPLRCSTVISFGGSQNITPKANVSWWDDLEFLWHLVLLHELLLRQRTATSGPRERFIPPGLSTLLASRPQDLSLSFAASRAPSPLDDSQHVSRADEVVRDDGVHRAVSEGQPPGVGRTMPPGAPCALPQRTFSGDTSTMTGFIPSLSKKLPSCPEPAGQPQHPGPRRLIQESAPRSAADEREQDLVLGGPRSGRGPRASRWGPSASVHVAQDALSAVVHEDAPALVAQGPLCTLKASIESISSGVFCH